ncbi:MAG: DNA polymerase IV [Pseudomonadota bacterium]|nr:DNA polymerase IV [Pseudomonadota bacterium]
MAARIACLDLDTFFVSVERLLDPSLVGQPVVVGGRKGSRGVVTSASYEVRTLGVRSGMPMMEAARLAPNAIFVPTRHDTYGPYAAQVRAVLERYCPVVRTASIDEFFLDFAGCERLYARPGDIDADATILRVVRELREAIQAEVKLPASVGIGTTRPVAKMASGRAKPAGVLLVRAGEERAFAGPLPVRRYPGIGPVAEARLAGMGITTLGQLLEVPDEDARVGALAASLRVGLGAGLRAGGGTRLPERDRPAFQEHDASAEGSLSNERTFFVDVGDTLVAEDALRALAERVTWRLRRRGARARTITLKLRFADFTTITRGRSVPPTHNESDVLAVVFDLLRGAWPKRARIRLLGVQLSNLVEPDPQVALFAPPRPRMGAAIDAVRDRFGYDAIRMGAVARPGAEAGVVGRAGSRVR